MTTQLLYPQYVKAPLSDWFRNHDVIIPSSETAITDIDFVIRHHSKSKHNGDWMIIETKCLMSEPAYPQWLSLKSLDDICRKGDPVHFKGVHIVQFTHTTPDNGKIYVDGIKMEKQTFIDFCNGDASEEIYKTKMFTDSKMQDKILEEKRRKRKLEMKN